MRNNENVVVSSSRVLLVPYSKNHVPRYHEWMKDPAIQEATASEPLTLEQEYKMQENWRQDADKLTFIVCQPVGDVLDGRKTINAGAVGADEHMIGDVNMFLTTSEDEEAGEMRLIGELELMIATKQNQSKGLGRAALLTFLRYITEHEDDIVEEFLSSGAHACQKRRLSCLCAKIGEQNNRSIGLFESLGFFKTSTKASYFGEFELRREGLSMEVLETLFEQHKLGTYNEMVYDNGHET
jgi:RimJ/RimL family protein N-acetyltransferase